MKRNLLALLLATAGVVPLTSSTFAQNKPAQSKPQPTVSAPVSDIPTDKLVRADGARIVPDRFLRAWDPITIFFDADWEEVDQFLDGDVAEGRELKTTLGIEDGYFVDAPLEPTKSELQQVLVSLRSLFVPA